MFIVLEASFPFALSFSSSLFLLFFASHFFICSYLSYLSSYFTLFCPFSSPPYLSYLSFFRLSVFLISLSSFLSLLLFSFHYLHFLNLAFFIPPFRSVIFLFIVTWRLKAGTVEPEEIFIARQRLRKQVSAATNTQITVEKLLGTMFSVRSVQSGYKKEFSWESAVEFRSSKWAVSREFGSATEAEKMALWVQLIQSRQFSGGVQLRVQVWSVNQRGTAWPRKMKNLHC
jgi:hypothetical protein